ncbi:hypothetical protein AMTRI_Chr01g111750 [Amborella trichopoda]
MPFVGWSHYHKAAPKLACCAPFLGKTPSKCILPIDQFLDTTVDSKETPLPPEFNLN